MTTLSGTPPSGSPPSRITKLAALAGQPSRRIVGLMSGTSLDGLDIALCTIHGAGMDTRVLLEKFMTRPYSAGERARFGSVVSQETVALADVCILNAWIAELHGRAVLAALNEWDVPPASVDLIASHGQTVYHAPASWNAEGSPRGSLGAPTDANRHATLQLGDGDLLAVTTGIVTLSDFRQKEIAGGGQGAPLAPYVEALLYAGKESRVLLNLGGIANFTWLPARGSKDAAPKSGDTGPANTLIDRAMRRVAPEGPGYDMDGAAAARGRVNPELLARLKAHPYFGLPCPKSTGPEMFGEAYLAEALERSGARATRGDDLVATLTRLTVDTIADALKREVPQLAGTVLYVSGGGQHNSTLVRWLAESLPGVRIADSSVLGIPPDAKEAVLFAVIANETVAGPGFLAADGSGRRLAFGKISLPD
jgi:anhydro-N-acetylmuramic acid kinase